MVKTLILHIQYCEVICSSIPVGKKKQMEREQINKKKTKQNTREDDVNQRRKQLKGVKSNLTFLILAEN